jgi:hypothetical protein
VLTVLTQTAHIAAAAALNGQATDGRLLVTGLKQCLTFLIIMSAINRMERVNGHGKESAEESRPRRTAGTRSSEQTNRSHPGG